VKGSARSIVNKGGRLWPGGAVFGGALFGERRDGRAYGGVLAQGGVGRKALMIGNLSRRHHHSTLGGGKSIPLVLGDGRKGVS